MLNCYIVACTDIHESHVVINIINSIGSNFAQFLGREIVVERLPRFAFGPVFSNSDWIFRPPSMYLRNQARNTY
jgi:hypothetical protein